jgi:hypothetical protein
LLVAKTSGLGVEVLELDCEALCDDGEEDGFEIPVDKAIENGFGLEAFASEEGEEFDMTGQKRHKSGSRYERGYGLFKATRHFHAGNTPEIGSSGRVI